MKHFSIISFALLLFSISVVKADEGMWLPLLLEQLNEPDMKNKGLKLSAEDIYSINKASLKDAVVLFGGGCTAELISSEGLLLTNHHCGYGQIQAHSTVKNDYLTNGFWAMNRSEELSNPDLTVTFIVKMEDVTASVLKGVTELMSEKERDSVISKNSKELEKKAVEGTHYEAKVKAFYYGNEYYLFVTETFKDIRMVGAPPSSIGKFGGETDNWMWPRHNGDFALFRIYAGKDNKPAEYSKENVPYKPKHFFPVSLKGMEDGDFTMVLGFPARTSEFLTSYAVEMIQNVSDPVRIKFRDKRISIMLSDMRDNDTVRIKYAAKYASVSNGYKKWKGELKGLRQYKAIEQKQNFEKTFLQRISTNPEKIRDYATILNECKLAYDTLKKYQFQYDYFMEGVWAVELLRHAGNFSSLVRLSKNKDTKPEELKKTVDDLQKQTKFFFKNYNAATDKKIFSALIKMFYEGNEKAKQITALNEINEKYKGDFNRYADELYTKTFLLSESKVNTFLTEYKVKNHKKIVNDPAYRLMRELNNIFDKNVLPEFTRLTSRTNQLQRTYMKAQREVMTEKKYYPDANSTLRLTYGKAGGYVPYDAAVYKHYTTLKGIMEKEDETNDEFIVPAKLKEIYEKKDYGQYADKSGEMRVCFIANNHTTGGNSGSPLLDAEGNLTGLNFDRNWEGTMADIVFAPEMVRNLCVDIRYVLLIIDKFAGAKHLINEMKIVK